MVGESGLLSVRCFMPFQVSVCFVSVCCLSLCMSVCISVFCVCVPGLVGRSSRSTLAVRLKALTTRRPRLSAPSLDDTISRRRPSTCMYDKQRGEGEGEGQAEEFCLCSFSTLLGEETGV